ncbi:MAG: HAMP domain-containing histidine kinase [Clostridiaceae bacterium]|nr:HAMP domain-containing histidine kinase [Clostridiaceae bacterium]NBH79771.1 sensor histidine kinase [Clostridiaceae bacterium]
MSAALRLSGFFRSGNSGKQFIDRLLPRLWGLFTALRAFLGRWWPLLLLAAAAALFLLLREQRLYRRLNRMIDLSIDGSILGETFDESRFSQLENKLYRFLNANSLSRRQLEADRAQIAELVSDISHQTKTPIANILLYSQLLQERGLDGESGALVDQVMAQSEKLRFLVESLVKASRLENGLVAVTPGAYPLAPLCAQLQNALAARAEEKGVALSWAVPEGIACWYDPKWTQEAIGNLLDNAIKYTPPGGNVTVTATEYELFCRIDITDTGIGITEAEQAHVFERFYRSPRVAQDEGVGIGLYLTRRIISAEGGYVKLRSKGQGTTFSVFLPRAAASS